MRGRSTERGAALFIVVMVIAMLTAIGVFAVRSTSLIEMASGYDRKAAQALYTSEFGLRGVVGDFAGKEDDYKRKIESGSNNCASVSELVGNMPAGSSISCYSMDKNELDGRVDTYGLPLSTHAEGLMGRVMRPGQEGTAEASFRVEITDLGPAPNPKAGTDLSGKNFKHRQVTFTATGQVRPTTASGTACNESNVQASSVQSLRSHVTFLSSN